MSNAKTKRWIAVVVLGLVALLLGKTILSISNKKKVLSSQKTLDELVITDISGQQIHYEGAGGRSTVLLFFNTECEYCLEETQGVKRSGSSLANVRIFFISSESIETIARFAHQQNLLSIPGVRVGRMDKKLLEKNFDVVTMPSTFIYDSQGILIKKFTGLTQFPAIEKYL